MKQFTIIALSTLGLAIVCQCCYVDAGAEAPGHRLSGILELCDPRPFTEMVASPGNKFGQRVIFRAEAGMMVLFPSWRRSSSSAR